MKLDTAQWETSKKAGVPFITLPKQQMDAILEQIEELEDLAAVRRFKASKEETIPAELVYACMDAKHTGQRIAAIRKFRKLTRDALGDSIGVTGASITMMETGKRKGTMLTIKKVADALGVPLDMLA